RIIDGDTVTLTNCTVTDNRSNGAVGGIQVVGSLSALRLQNTIVANNVGPNFVNNSGTVTSLGNNLASDSGGGLLIGAGDQINTNPLLAPLGNNGGPTPTHLLLPGSPAIDKGGAGVSTDQRGLPRPFDIPGVTNAANGNGSDIGAVEIQCSAITLAGLPGGTAGIPYTAANIASGGTAPYSLSLASGSLPPGVTISGNGLTGTPTQIGLFSFTLLATDAYGCQNSQSYTISITCPAITLSPAALPNATVNVAYPQVLTASPAGSYTFSVTNGLLPVGLTLNGNGTFSGAPTQSGVFNFRVTATAFGSCSGFTDYVLLVNCPAITVSPASLPGGTVGTPYNQTVSASPAGSYVFSVTAGSLPPGLSLNPATGAITGMPTAAGEFSFDVTASAGGCAGSRNYIVAISCTAASFTTTTLPAGTAGNTYSQTLSVSPAGSYTFSLTQGNLPSGLTLNPFTGVISGLPAVTGTTTFIVKAETTSGCIATQSYTLTIGCPAVTVNPASLPNGSIGVAYSQSLSASPAGGNYSFALTSGNLPPGLNLNPATGSLSGSPTTNGAFTFTITATGFGGCTGSQAYTVTIGSGGCPTITLPASLPNGSVGQLYSASAAASPAGSYNYSATGSLPPGVTLYSSIGLVFGYPTAAGSYTFTITATAGACSVSQQYTVLIGAGFASSLTVFSDFDGDGKSDLSVFQGSDGNWLVANSGDGQLHSTPWGSSAAPYNDLAVSGDYDGDGKTDLAVFRRGAGQAGYWFIKRSSDGEVMRQHWGLATDVPVPGDYDSDGKTDIAVWRGSVGGWYILRSSDGDVEGRAWGSAAAGDIPVPGDYDGDSKTDVAVFRRGDGHWYIQRSSDGSTVNVEWGAGTDLPVPGDYDADGKTDLAVWRGSEGNWYIIESSGAALRTITLGSAAEGDIPVTADYDGDGKADAAIWRAFSGTWAIRRSSDDTEVTKAHGQSGDQPIMARRN
ncbi:MAG TPA: putative Ig domain-containing protein, partial [Blastocatellia bacterium]